MYAVCCVCNMYRRNDNDALIHHFFKILGGEQAVFEKYWTSMISARLQQLSFFGEAISVASSQEDDLKLAKVALESPRARASCVNLWHPHVGCWMVDIHSSGC